MLGISNPSPIPEESNPTEELNENWLIPMIPIDVLDSLLISDSEGVPDDQLCKGSTFWTKDALSIAVGLWNIHHRAEYKVARSDSKRLIIVYKHEDHCPFEVRATWRETFWIVYKFTEEHTCMNDLSRVAPRQVHAKVIAAYFAKQMRGEGQIMKPKDIRAKMLEEFGIRTSYSVALRARNTAIEMIYGGHEDSFKMLPSYLYMLEQTNPAFGCNPETLIVSDAHISISNAVQEVFPGTSHGLCYYHLLNNFTRYGKGVTSMFYKAAYSYRRTAYNKAMAGIHALSPNGAYTKLMDIGPERWARSKCPVRHYGFLTSNAEEVLNARLLWARRLPICSLIECIRHVIEQWFDSRRARANARDNALTEEALKKLREEVEKSRVYNVVPTSNSTFKVHGGRQRFIVDLHQKSCKCREFQLDLMPCSHAVAAIMKNGESILDYVTSYYTMDNWRETYEGSVRSLSHRDDWVVPAHIAQQKVTPLIVTRQAGRPSGHRHPSGAEAANRRRRRPKKCSIYLDPNHSRNNCPNRDR
ncbi:hypothetical protein C2S53_005338 [Perilla frutescens var. hirtella]|uniref:SWIM-type domain-containing protein n=1 Tax=Perilla frutescens var. hirtella TaxID=608512 RepID=A0AAD4JHI3_PERFH|nr:hypothetical protein C2S53_005338 [Perilla frutescens var. hirtella]